MLRRLVSLIGPALLVPPVLVAACTSSIQGSEAPDEDPAGAATRPVASVPDAPARPAKEATPIAAPAGPLCDYPAVAPRRHPALQAASPGACRSIPAKVRSAVRQEVRKGWMRSWPKGTLEIRDGCDVTEGPLESAVIESAGGHGGSLTLTELRRRADGDYDLVLVDYNHYFGGGPRDRDDPWTEGTTGTLEIRRGTVAAGRVEPIFVRMRALVALEIEEREPPPREGVIHGGSHTFSSHDYHAALRLRDARGVGVQRVFTGYASSGPEQRDGVPLAVVASDLHKLIDDEALRATWPEVGTGDPAARDLLARVFWEERDRSERIGAWFVRERLLALTARLGGPELMPALLDALRIREGTSIDRVHVLAVAAIAAITGFDVRRDAGGSPRAREVVVDETLAACGEVAPNPNPRRIEG